MPPLNEQRRVVERIEALFDEIDRGVESLRDAKRGIELYRQSLLKSAFQGHLTADWRAENPDKLECPEALLGRIQRATTGMLLKPRSRRLGTRPWQLARGRGGDGQEAREAQAAAPHYCRANRQWHSRVDNRPTWLSLVVDPIYGTPYGSVATGLAKATCGVLRIPNIADQAASIQRLT